jgi:hypothetical protein
MPRCFGEALLLRYRDEDRQGVEAVLHIVAIPETESAFSARFNCRPQCASSASTSTSHAPMSRMPPITYRTVGIRPMACSL